MAVESEDRSMRLREWSQSFGISLALVTLASSLIAVPLSAAQQLDLADGQVTAWVMTIYTLPCVIGIVLTLYFRQPLLLTGNIFVLISIVSLQGRVTFAELAGASMVAGAAVVAITALGLTEHLAELIPEPVVVGLLAGSTLPFVAGIFTGMGSAPVVIGAAFLAFILGRKYLEDRVPAIFLAMLVGIAAAVALGRFATADGNKGPSLPVLTSPVFAWDAILTATPVMVVLICPPVQRALTDLPAGCAVPPAGPFPGLCQRTWHHGSLLFGTGRPVAFAAGNGKGCRNRSGTAPTQAQGRGSDIWPLPHHDAARGFRVRSRRRAAVGTSGGNPVSL